MSTWTNINFKVTKHTDEFTFHTIQEALIGSKFSINTTSLIFEIGGPQISFQGPTPPEKESKEIEETFKEQSQLISQFGFNFGPNLSISLNRPPTRHPTRLTSIYQISKTTHNSQIAHNSQSQ